jgi:hypothetical protein
MVGWLDGAYNGLLVEAEVGRPVRSDTEQDDQVRLLDLGVSLSLPGTSPRHRYRTLRDIVLVYVWTRTLLAFSVCWTSPDRRNNQHRRPVVVVELAALQHHPRPIHQNGAIVCCPSDRGCRFRMTMTMMCDADAGKPCDRAFPNSPPVIVLYVTSMVSVQPLSRDYNATRQ